MGRGRQPARQQPWQEPGPGRGQPPQGLARPALRVRPLGQRQPQTQGLAPGPALHLRCRRPADRGNLRGSATRGRNALRLRPDRPPHRQQRDPAQVRHASPVRYRCHTGHAFTARVLESLQAGKIEEALWAAVRAMHEQKQLYRQLYQMSGAQGNSAEGTGDPRDEYLTKAERARQQAQVLRELITARLRIGTFQARSLDGAASRRQRNHLIARQRRAVDAELFPAAVHHDALPVVAQLDPPRLRRAPAHEILDRGRHAHA